MSAYTRCCRVGPTFLAVMLQGSFFSPLAVMLQGGSGITLSCSDAAGQRDFLSPLAVMLQGSDVAGARVDVLTGGGAVVVGRLVGLDVHISTGGGAFQTNAAYGECLHVETGGWCVVELVAGAGRYGSEGWPLCPWVGGSSRIQCWS